MKIARLLKYRIISPLLKITFLSFLGLHAIIVTGNRLDTLRGMTHLVVGINCKTNIKIFPYRANLQKQKLLNFQKAQESGGTSLVA